MYYFSLQISNFIYMQLNFIYYIFLYPALNHITNILNKTKVVYTILIILKKHTHTQQVDTTTGHHKHLNAAQILHILVLEYQVFFYWFEIEPNWPKKCIHHTQDSTFVLEIILSNTTKIVGGFKQNKTKKTTNKKTRSPALFF